MDGTTDGEVAATKDLEIHYLRCGATDSKIATVNALLSVPPGKSVKGSTLSKDLPLLKNMSLADVEWEIRVRGTNTD